MFVVDRLDIQFGVQEIETFLQATYDITYFREYRALKFKLINKKNRDNLILKIPNEFFLYKTLDLQFEQYKNIRETVFRGMSRVDKNNKTK